MILQSIHFEGRVQGVGFRYRTCEVARRYAVVGTVQNLPDGRVKVLVEGEMAEVKAFVQSVCEAMRGNIHAHTAEQLPVVGGFQGFRVVP